ncbi:phosphonopyruvate decarboxylase [Campylobacter aviculae]|uniref:Phosphonopyruvate decarboxylase n=1 Tax=Campylobacter aviculae TaxID=2510190 RepID=A0A4V6DVU6_9BACT|nr:phosphonopyruvate decarboxylase [Campylobacter aviculae]TKX28872.1 phosphonopyruvate decarboxylase [Campylobacter aviculae]
MINSLEFADFLNDKFSFFAGVPDSLLKSLNNALELKSKNNFFVTANEGQAIAFASAYNLSTSKIALVYMQNSGLGNAINPLLSLADPKVYKIPLIMFIGLRGGKDDEPQHLKQGEVTKKILQACGIKSFFLSQNIKKAKEQIDKAIQECNLKKQIIAFLIKKNTFDNFKTIREKNNFKIIREEAISLIQDYFNHSKFIATTGMIARECYELRKIKKQTHANDFLVVGSMGYASSLAFIISKYSKKHIVCLDGDGAFIMHMGSILNFKNSNFLHIVLNNQAHDSVGGQFTHAKNASFSKLSKACGYNYSFSVKTMKDLKNKLEIIKKLNGLIFLEIKVKQQTRKDLLRPKDILMLKEEFCKEL